MLHSIAFARRGGPTGLEQRRDLASQKISELFRWPQGVKTDSSIEVGEPATTHKNTQDSQLAPNRDIALPLVTALPRFSFERGRGIQASQCCPSPVPKVEAPATNSQHQSDRNQPRGSGPLGPGLQKILCIDEGGVPQRGCERSGPISETSAPLGAGAPGRSPFDSATPCWDLPRPGKRPAIGKGPLKNRLPRAPCGPTGKVGRLVATWNFQR